MLAGFTDPRVWNANCVLAHVEKFSFGHQETATVDNSTGVSNDGSIDSQYPQPRLYTDEQNGCVCTQCSKVFESRIDLGIHMELHSRPLTCEICQKGYKSKRDYISHMNSHMNHRPHTCTFCGKGFSYRNSMVRHMNKFCAPKLTTNIYIE